MTHNSYADASQAHPHRDELRELQADIRAEEARELAASERISAAQVAYDEALQNCDASDPEYEVRLFDAMKEAIAVADALAAPTAKGGTERVRHVKRGTEYEVLGEAELQIATRSVFEEDRVAVVKGA